MNEESATSRRYRLLLLCHTTQDIIGHCDTTGIPLSIDTLQLSTTMDMDRSGRPEHVVDITRPLPSGKQHLRRRFNVITTVCCPSDVFIEEEGQGLVLQSWENIAYMLQQGGYFIFTTALYGVHSAAKFLKMRIRTTIDMPRKKQAKVIQALAKYIHAQWPNVFRHIPLTGTSKDTIEFQQWYAGFLGRHGRRFLTDSKKYEAPTLEWMHDNGLVVFQRV